jgi:hypothetical protein
MNDWLASLEDESGAYLWPRTPVGNIQAEIWRRVGASDWNMDDPRCRAASIIDTLQDMDENGLLPRPFTVLDLCCGDGVVLMQIGRAFLDARCYGIDILSYPSHRIAERKGGCSFYKVPLQRLIEAEPPMFVDACVMLNTFRGWDKADLSPKEYDLPEKTLRWLKQWCRYIFVTATTAQMDWLKREGFFVWDVGAGEDRSRLLCGFPCEGPEGPTGVWNLGKPK